MTGRSWDTTKARALYDEGYSDGEIAKKLGTTRNAVAFWRRKQRLTANRKKQTAAKAPVPPASDLPTPAARPLVLPKVSGQVELSVELNGCAFALRAPNLECAAWAYEYIGRLLSDLKKAELVREGEHG